MVDKSTWKELVPYQYTADDYERARWLTSAIRSVARALPPIQVEVDHMFAYIGQGQFILTWDVLSSNRLHNQLGLKYPLNVDFERDIEPTIIAMEIAYRRGKSDGEDEKCNEIRKALGV